jgi:hypothetical protein
VTTHQAFEMNMSTAVETEPVDVKTAEIALTVNGQV